MLKITSAADPRWWRTQPKLPPTTITPNIQQIKQDAFKQTWNKLLKGEDRKQLRIGEYKYAQENNVETKAKYDGINEAVELWYQRLNNLKHHIPIEEPDIEPNTITIEIQSCSSQDTTKP